MRQLSPDAHNDARHVVSVVACAFIVAVGVVVVVAHAGVMFTNDGGAHLYSWYAAAHADEPMFAGYITRNPMITGHGLPELFMALEPALGWRHAFTACTTASVLVYAAGFFAVVVALTPRRSVVALLAAPLSLQHLLYLGLFHYLLGVGVGLLAVAWWLRRRSTVVDHAVAGLLLYLAASIHPFAAAVAGAVLAAVTIFDAPAAPAPRSRLARVCAVVVVGVPAASVAWLSASVLGIPTPDVWPDLADRLEIFAAFDPALGRFGAALIVWPALVVSGVLALRAGSATRALALCGLVLVLVTALGPRDYANWQFVGLRPLPFAAPLLAATLPFDLERAKLMLASRIALLAIIAFVVASLTSSFVLHGRMRAKFEPVVDRIDALAPAPAARGSIMLRPEPPMAIPVWDPWQRLPHIAGVRLGGVSLYGFAGRGTDPIRIVPHEIAGPVPPPELNYFVPPVGDPGRAPYVRRLTALNAPLVDLVAFGTPADLDIIEAGGFQRTVRDDAGDASLLVARFVGCSARFHVTGDVDVGWWPLKDATGLSVVDGAVVSGLGCGPMWFHFAAENGKVCREADAAGRIRATLARDAVVDVTCTP